MKEGQANPSNPFNFFGAMVDAGKLMFMGEVALSPTSPRSAGVSSPTSPSARPTSAGSRDDGVRERSDSMASIASFLGPFSPKSPKK